MVSEREFRLSSTYSTDVFVLPHPLLNFTLRINWSDNFLRSSAALLYFYLLSSVIERSNKKLDNWRPENACENIKSIR